MVAAIKSEPRPRSGRNAWPPYVEIRSHVGRSGVQDPPIHVALKQFLLALLGKQPVNFTHMPACHCDCGQSWSSDCRFVTLDFAGVAMKCLVNLLVFPV